MKSPINKPNSPTSPRLPGILLILSLLCATSLTAGDWGTIRGKVTAAGEPLPNAWVETCTGLRTTTDANGGFDFPKLSQAAYAVKILSPGLEEKVIGEIKVAPGKTTEVSAELQKETNGKTIVTGNILDKKTGKPLPATLYITDGDKKPVRWFDTAGVPYGGRTDVKGWHEKSKKYWTRGEFTFSVPPGTVTITAIRTGYKTERIKLEAVSGKVATANIQLAPFVDMKALGWYAGDFHAHCVHGEKFYKVNVPFAAFVTEAEGYDWFYLSSSHANDGVKCDYERIAREQSSDRLFLRLNTEFPKTRLGHIGNIGAPVVPRSAYHQQDRYTNTELVREHIVKQGGIAAPVHPVYRNPRKEKTNDKTYYWMQYNELPFALVAAPNLLKGIDIFYPSHNFDEAYDLWFMLLNQGYRLSATASCDAAFDLGRTPGGYGKLYLQLSGTTPSEESIKDAFAAGRSFVSYDETLIDFRIDGKCSGSVFRADGKTREVAMTVYSPAGKKLVLELIRNGKVHQSFPIERTVSGANRHTATIKETENAWYVARIVNPKSKHKATCASPIYFETKDHVPLQGAMATVKGKIIDKTTQKPVTGATLALVDYRTVISTQVVPSEFEISLRPYHRLRVSAPGYKDLEKSIALDSPPIRESLYYLDKEQLHDWGTYKKMKKLLIGVELEFSLGR